VSALWIATHNIMNGLRLAGLIAAYRRQAERGLDLLCLQEDRPIAGGLPSDRIGAALGARFGVVRGGDGSGLAAIYRTDRLAVTASQLIALPRLDRLSWLERRYIAGGAPERKYAQRIDLACDGRAITVANFHLDTAGDNDHRARQVDAIAGAVAGTALVACGDTNVFALRRRDQPAALARVTAGFAALGATDPDHRPTHFFARQGEPSPAHRLAALVGRAGFDLPRRYDVICTNLPVAGRGHLHTPDSDHDLVWAAISLD
jgi:endonuclease/exonuclease/phosphatase family metal-dependent hydrolase